MTIPRVVILIIISNIFSWTFWNWSVVVNGYLRWEGLHCISQGSRLAASSTIITCTPICTRMSLNMHITARAWLSLTPNLNPILIQVHPSSVKLLQVRSLSLKGVTEIDLKLKNQTLSQLTSWSLWVCSANLNRLVLVREETSFQICMDSLD